MSEIERVRCFAGIVLQEYSVAEGKLIGERRIDLQGHAAGLHRRRRIFISDGLVLSAYGGGGHGLEPRRDDGAIALPRRALRTPSRGPYSKLPRSSGRGIAKNRPRRSVKTQDGGTYMVYLCGRPLRNRGRCTLGRETAIQPMTWSADGWLRTTNGQGIAQPEAAAPALPGAYFPARARPP